MIAGAAMYFSFAACGLEDQVKEQAYGVISHIIQPSLIAMMLFLSFTKVNPHDLRPHRWQVELLAVQTAAFILCAAGAMLSGDDGMKVLFEGAMLCFLCPTATASAVITGKLGGSLSGVTTYLLMCNLMVALLGPLFLTLVEPHQQLDFVSSFFIILGKVFPLLTCPLLAAWLVRYLFPKLHQWLLGYTGLSFYMWAVALALAIMVTVKSIMTTHFDLVWLIGLAIVSAVCCAIQFVAGKYIGSRYDNGDSHEHRITSGQAFGQKNTVFAIWLGLTFLNPITSTVGGFYSVWHNVVNSWQLYKARKNQSLGFIV